MEGGQLGRQGEEEQSLGGRDHVCAAVRSWRRSKVQGTRSAEGSEMSGWLPVVATNADE